MPRLSAAAVSFSLLLWACGGSSPPALPPPPETSLEPELGQLDAQQVTHLLRRTQWTTGAYALGDSLAGGIDDYLQELLDSTRRDLATEAAALSLIADLDHPTANELVRWWLHLMVNSRVPFREIMAFFWHDHFATSIERFDRYSRHLVKAQIEKLRWLGTGDLRQLLYFMLTDPAMLIWLNGVDNTREQINENLAREFYELFTLGVDNGYTQADIQETARAFTGYRVMRDETAELDRVVFDPNRADTSLKTIFGRTGNHGFHEVVDLVLAERPVAEFICKRLFEHFCYPNAPPEVVAQLAAMLRTSNYHIAPVLYAILRSRAFFAGRSRESHLKSPVEMGVGLLRTTRLAMPLPIVDYFLASQGQRPLAPPNVGGWPDDDEWLASGSLVLRGQFAHALATARQYQSQHGTPITLLLPAVSERTANAVVKALADRLGLVLTPVEIADYEQYLNTLAVEEGTELRLQPDPFRGDDGTHVNERARGLLFLLAQHPSYLLR
ncbi:MAG TPA: DUF1800 domain-containing protein [Planctomycetota bacterium]|nr:DUF1800 domain-containing protein [Planctomycetota bacterium]